MLATKMRLPKISTLVWLAAVFMLICTSCSQTKSRVRTELVKLKTADGVWLNGVVRELHPNRADSGVVMVHGYGGNFYSGTMSFLPETLAEHGYTTLALNMRDHDLGPKKNLFEENLPDIAAGVDELTRRGCKDLFFYGHSMGTNRVLFYLAETQDPRIKGIILSGPPGNLFQWNIRIFGRKAATEVLRRAQKLKREGEGNTWMLIDLGPLGKTLYTANHVVSLRGPATRSDPFTNIAQFSRPVLIVHGSADRLADPSVADKLKNSAAAENQVKVVKLTGADHRFHNNEKKLEEVITKWLVEQLSQ
ncbi:MAG: alpha/beta fold hydrolase [Syntrophobacterales bacterium]